MHSFNAIWLILIVPFIIWLWHMNRTDGKRPSAFAKIDGEPVRPAVIIDIAMPFSSMVVFITKLAIAALPAIVLITGVVGLLYVAMFGMMGLGYRGL